MRSLARADNADVAAARPLAVDGAVQLHFEADERAHGYFPCAVSAGNGVTTMVSAGTVAYFFVTTRSTTRLSSATTIALTASRPAFTKLSASGRVVGRMSPRSAASRRLPDQLAGTGKSMTISQWTGPLIGGLPSIATWAASFPWASNRRVFAGV